MDSLIIVATFLISIAIGMLIGMVLRKKIAESKIEGAEKEAKRLVDLAKVEAENMKKIKRLKKEEAKFKSKKQESFKRRKIWKNALKNLRKKKKI